jgi:hypothetical protein
MNPYAMETIARQRTAEFRAEAARNQVADSRAAAIKDLTGWALIQVGLALVTSSAPRQHGPATSPELP